MKKLKSKLLSIISYGLIGYTTGAAVIQGIPELQALMPSFTTQIAVWTGLPAVTLGSIGLAVQSYINKARVTDNVVNQGVVDAVSKLYAQVKDVAELYNQGKGDIKELAKDMKKNIDDIRNEYILLRNDVKLLAKLVRVDMEAKLSNPLIDEEVKKMLGDAINEV